MQYGGIMDSKPQRHIDMILWNVKSESWVLNSTKREDMITIYSGFNPARLIFQRSCHLSQWDSLVGQESKVINDGELNFIKFTFSSEFCNHIVPNLTFIKPL